MVLSLRTLATLAFVGVASAGIAPRKAPLRLSPLLNKQLSVHGGAGPLDPTVVAKVSALTSLAHGVYSTFAPEASIKAYMNGGDEPSEMAVQSAKGLGVTLLSVSASACSILFKDCSVNTAAGISVSFWAIEFAARLLTGKAKKLGYSKVPECFWLLADVAMAYVTFSEADYALQAMKGFSTFVGISCAPFMLTPTFALKSYGYDEESMDDLSLVYTKALGSWLVGFGVFEASLASGVDVTKAWGYAQLPALVTNFIGCFVTKEVEKLGGNKKAVYFWLGFTGVVAGALIAG